MINIKDSTDLFIIISAESFCIKNYLLMLDISRMKYYNING